MPDIVLKDRSGDSQSFDGATALGVDTTDGGIAVFVSKDMIPETYTHPETHPASMITGLFDVAKSGRFESLIDRPFGKLSTLLEETTLTFAQSTEFEGCYTTAISGLYAVKDADYYVVFDGKTYLCTCKDINDIHPSFSGSFAIGNMAIHPFNEFIGGEDTGEPFIICVTANEGVSSEYGQCSIITRDSAETHTVSITPVNEVKKLDAKYLPDEAATKEYVQEEISKIEVGGNGITAADVTAMLASAGVVVPVAVEDNLLLTDSDGDIYIL